MVAVNVELKNEWLLPESTRIRRSRPDKEPCNCIVLGEGEPVTAADDSNKNTCSEEAGSPSAGSVVALS
jgi:hypothetical protein